MLSFLINTGRINLYLLTNLGTKDTIKEGRAKGEGEGERKQEQSNRAGKATMEEYIHKLGKTIVTARMLSKQKETKTNLSVWLL